jgi:hypothetical protein
LKRSKTARSIILTHAIIEIMAGLGLLVGAEFLPLGEHTPTIDLLWRFYGWIAISFGLVAMYLYRRIEELSPALMNDFLRVLVFFHLGVSAFMWQMFEWQPWLFLGALGLHLIFAALCAYTIVINKHQS